MITATVSKPAMVDDNLSPEQEEARLVAVFKTEIEFLREIPMFANLEDVELARLCQVASHRRYPAGTVLLGEGQVNGVLYMVRKGFVELSRHHTHDERSEEHTSELQ